MKKLILILTAILLSFGAFSQEVVKRTGTEISSSATNPIHVTETNPASGGMPTAIYALGTELGSVAYTSNVTITLSGSFPTITSDAQLVYIKYIPTAGSGSAIIVNGQSGVTLTHAANVITVDGGGTPFVAGDVYEVGINAPKFWEDYTIEAEKNLVQNPIWARYTDASDILTGDLTLTTSFADFGAEIDMRGYKELYVYLTLDINDASNVRFRALGKHESGGTDEYNMVIATVSSSDIKVDVEYVEFNNDADQLVILHITTNNCIPYIQLQAMEGTDGGVDAIFTGPTKGVKAY